MDKELKSPSTCTYALIRDELYPYFVLEAPDDYYQCLVEFTEDEEQWIVRGMMEFREVQKFLAAKYGEASKKNKENLNGK
jgi:hypothetical protein